MVRSSSVPTRDVVAASGSQPAARSSPSGDVDRSQGSLELDPAVPGLLWMRGEVDVDVVGLTAAQRRVHEELMDGVDVVDASQVTFIDSTGVHLLIVAAAAARRRGTTLRLRQPADHVVVLVQVMGLGGLFDIVKSS